MSLVEVEAQVVGLKIGKGFPSLMNIYVSQFVILLAGHVERLMLLNAYCLC